MLFLELLALAVIVCFICDLSGLEQDVKRLIWRWVFGKNKPYQDFPMKIPFCSLCMVHHTLLIWALITSNFSLFTYMIICILSLLASNISGFMRLIKEVMIKTENKLYDILFK